jgi:hypothetical protein
LAYIGPGNYVVVVRHVGDFTAYNNKLVSQREPRTVKTRFASGSFLPNEEPKDVRKLFEETCLTLAVDDLTLLSNNLV